MARFKKVRRYASKAYKSVKRYAKSEKETPLETALFAGGYGLVRPYAANMIPDVPQLGGYSDNLILGGAGFLAAWKGKGIVKKAGKTILAIEAFVAASKASSGIMSNSSSTGDYNTDY